MRRTNRSITLLFAAAGLLALLPAGDAAAEQPRNALDSQPAVRHRLLLVKKRFELTTVFESSINADYKHVLSGGLKGEFHLSDMISFGAIGAYGKSINTGLVDRIVETLPSTATPGDPTPTEQQYLQHLNEMPVHGAAYITFTPWYGKLAAFGKAFVNFDFYFSGGLAIAQLATSCEDTVCTDDEPGDPGRLGPMGEVEVPPDSNPNDDPALNDGLKKGLYLGGGIHVFLNEWIALDLTVRDYVFDDNPSGLDTDRDNIVKEADNGFAHHLFMGVGVSFFLPGKAQRTN